MIKTTFNFNFVFLDKFYPSIFDIKKHEEIISKIEKTPTAFDLSKFFIL